MSRSLVVLLVLSLSPIGARAYHREDTLRGGTAFGNPIGGAFGPEGWTVTSRTDRMWFAVPRLVTGSIEFTMSNVTWDNLVAADNEVFAMYEAGYGIEEPIGYSPELRNNHYKCLLRIYGTDEPGRTGEQKLMWGMCPSGAPGHDACGCGSFFEEPFGGDPSWDGSPQRIRIEWGAGVTRLLRNGVEAVRIDWADSGLVFGPDTLHFSLGTPRPDSVGSAAMPIGAVFSDLVVDGVEGPVAMCPGPPDAGPPPGTDAGVGVPACTASQRIVAVGLDPADGRGSAQVFRATYRHCDGASTFRVVQLTVTDEVGSPGEVGLGYEGGLFYAGAESCAPGEARVIRGTAAGALDCARSSVRDVGDDRVVDWAVLFDPTVFAGPHHVYFDAKGGPDPEPRLGWTRMGRFTVAEDPLPDGGTSASMDAAATEDAGEGTGRPPNVSGCGCRAAGSPGGAPTALLLLAALGLRTRARAPQARRARS